MPVVSNKMVKWHEKTEDLSVISSSLKTKSSINLIVLGGGINYVDTRKALSISGLQIKSIKRVFAAYNLYLRHPTLIKTIIITGGAGHGSREAGTMADLFIHLGVDKSLINIEDSSLTTYQNAVNTLRSNPHIVHETNILITSALHMRRATYAFEALGIPVIQYPVDSIYLNSNILLPRLTSLQKSFIVIRELLAYYVYKFKY